MAEHPGADDPAGSVTGSAAGLVAAAVVVLLVGALAAVGVALGPDPSAAGGLGRASGPAVGPAPCRTVTVAAGRARGVDERTALDALLAVTDELPADGWVLGEPNRYSRTDAEALLLVSLHQVDETTWEAVRYDVCPLG